MTTEQIEFLADDLKKALREAQQISQERDFYRRVLKQIVIQNGGEVAVDSSFGEAAQSEKRSLFIGNGYISLN